MSILEIFIFIILFIITFGIGSQDETSAPIYANGSFSSRKVLIFGSIFAFLGVVFFSQKVGQTIGANLLASTVTYTEETIIAILLGVMLWILIATWRNVPISITHSVLGTLIGVAIAWSLYSGQNFLISMNWVNVGIIFLGLLISPLLGFVIAYLAQGAIDKLMKRYTKGLTQIESAEKILQPFVLIFAGLNAISRSGNDSGKVLGVVYTLLNGNQSLSTDSIYIILIVGGFYAVGQFIVGRQLMVSVGSSTGGQLRPSEALAIEISVSVILFTATILGLPISGTQVLVFALIGSARMKGEKPDPKTYNSTIKSWVLTIPIAAILGFIFFFIVQFLF